MPSGIRATVQFTSPNLCPIVELSRELETTIDSVSTNVCPADCAECVTEFSVASAADIDGEFTQIFSHGSTDRYRYTHSDGVNCPCESLGTFGCSVSRYVAENGTLTLVFHAADYDQLQAVVADLRERFPGIDVKRFVRSLAPDQAHDTVFVDRSKLTERQLEVLTAAYERGYFERPRQTNATELAAELGINRSTFTEHLVAAESKLLEDIL